MESGCSFHMSPKKQWFEDLELLNGGIVLLGNNNECKIVGFGSIRIRI